MNTIGTILMSRYEQENVQFGQSAERGKFKAYLTNSHCISLFLLQIAKVVYSQLAALSFRNSVCFFQKHQNKSMINVL